MYAKESENSQNDKHNGKLNSNQWTPKYTQYKPLPGRPADTTDGQTNYMPHKRSKWVSSFPCRIQFAHLLSRMIYKSYVCIKKKKGSWYFEASDYVKIFHFNAAEKFQNSY